VAKTLGANSATWRQIWGWEAISISAWEAIVMEEP